MKICNLSDIPAGAARGYVLPGPGAGRPVVVVRGPAGVRAYENRCPHTGVNLDWNPDVFMDVDGRHLQCSTHGALFRVEDGYCIHGPCAGQGLEPVPIRVEAGSILLVAGPPADSQG